MNRESPALFLSLLLLALPLFASAARKTAAVPGGWTPIKDLDDPHVVEIGKFSVAEHNQEAKTNLKFVKVVSGEQQVVSGVNYRLIIAADDPKDGVGKPKDYQAVVWEKEWEHFRKLTSFKPFVKA
ncbi:cysteine proteinase inhibitor 5 [Carica papaya]|uniref:cysteine proteinase inhibitor 5 n=1 Tax=Carica papaya TaxID=3649 RepID=UPI000B8CB446|nr:cysteine proteinase inhibitor 5 [Carica papaya]